MRISFKILYDNYRLDIITKVNTRKKLRKNEISINYK